MENRMHTDVDLAAALFWALGGSMPHNRSREEEARKIAGATIHREKLLLQVVALCGNPTTPKQFYILTKVYSWLGTRYRKETIRFADKYLESEGWKELPHKIVRQDGILISQAVASRASVLLDLAQAQDGEGFHDAALSNYMEAYRLEPYNAMCVIKAADVIASTHGREEAYNFLNNQKSSKYYTPVKYIDERGETKRNEVFRQLLDAHIRKMQEPPKEPAW